MPLFVLPFSQILRRIILSLLTVYVALIPTNFACSEIHAEKGSIGRLSLQMPNPENINSLLHYKKTWSKKKTVNKTNLTYLD